jgi:hypothetical protein
MGELFLHVIFGLLIYPVCIVVFRFFNTIEMWLFKFSVPCALFIPGILHYGIRIILPLAWVSFGFSFGPKIVSEEIKTATDALVFIYFMAWLFGVGTLLFMVFTGTDKGNKYRDLYIE